MSDVYDEAKKPGGKHHGFLRTLPAMGLRQRSKAAESYQEQLASHQHLDKISSPLKYVDGWDDLRDSHKATLIRNWRKEVEDRLEQIAVSEGVRR